MCGKEVVMKKPWRWLVLAGWVTVMVEGCGGGGFVNNSGEPSNFSTPVISNLQFVPSSATRGTASAAVSGSFYFVDNGADMTGGVAILKGYDSHQNLYFSSDIPHTGYALSATSGTAILPVQISTYQAGVITIVLYITDGKGHKSNEITGTFTIE